MRIGNNILNTRIAHQLEQTQRAINRSLNRLSSGARLTSPSENVADFTTSIRLQSQIRGISQSVQNINSELGLVETAYSALQSQMDILQEIRTLAVKSANASLSTETRTQIQTQLDSLITEFDRITKTTEFNQIHLLNGSLSELALDASSDQPLQLSLPDQNLNNVFKTIDGASRWTIAKDEGVSGFITDEAAASADLDGDGNLDLVFAENSAGNLLIRLGDGEGGFRTAQSFAVTAGTRTQIVDYNHDNILDILTIDTGAGEVLKFKGLGDGQFEEDGSIVSNDPLKNFEYADINSDGYEDLILVSQVGNTVNHEDFINDGEGNFSFSTSSNISNSASATTFGDIKVGDFNNDGIDDLVTTYAITSTVYTQILLNNGDGTFSTETTGSAGTFYDLAVKDIDGDGKDDILELNRITGLPTHYDLVQVLLNEDGSISGLSNSSLGTTQVTNLDFSDVNNDGRLDVLGLRGGAIVAYYQNSQGKFSDTPSITVLSEGGSKFKVFDLNNDGIDDLLGSSDTFTSTLSFQLTKNISALPDLDVSSAEKASKLIEIADQAIDLQSQKIANISNVHNILNLRLDHLFLKSENLEEAYSKIHDTDIAEEVSTLVSNQILQQAQIAAFAQANVNLQIVLKLLDF